MSKELSEMTLEELWRLFPIQLTEHNPGWADIYREMEAQLTQALTEFPKARISHIGSTAVNGIWAKPIVDILVELGPDEDMEQAVLAIEQSGFGCMNRKKNRISFNVGYTKEGFADKVYHLHLRRRGDNDELYFRDYLNEFPEIAKEYERLKLELWRPYEFNRDGYTAAKGEFVARCTGRAKERYGDRYKEGCVE